ncbi:MAG TPA: hypothetical protein VFX96_04940 [Pyrinomonadaceae bacterium]|nr:hypothetical protein [Pyrinomonadaceae bacterium]
MATKKSGKKSAKKSTKKAAGRASKKRGSAKLAGPGRGGFSPAAIRALIATFRKFKLSPDILIDGTPVPDIIRGSFTATSAGGVSSGLAALFKLRDARYRPIRLFPDGIPVPDIYRVEFDARFRR